MSQVERVVAVAKEDGTWAGMGTHSPSAAGSSSHVPHERDDDGAHVPAASGSLVTAGEGASPHAHAAGPGPTAGSELDLEEDVPHLARHQVVSFVLPMVPRRYDGRVPPEIVRVKEGDRAKVEQVGWHLSVRYKDVLVVPDALTVAVPRLRRCWTRVTPWCSGCSAVHPNAWV